MTLTIITTVDDEQLITELCTDLDIKTASGLFLHLLRTYKNTAETDLALREIVIKQSKYIDSSNHVIGSLQDAFHSLNIHKLKDY